MNILLVGSGGREHALAWKIAQSPKLTRLVCAPGNPGIAALCETRPAKVTDIDAIIALAQEIAADLVVIGPESTLELGVADRLQALGIPCFGASQSAARLETSKAFTKAFAQRWSLPTADFAVIDDASTINGVLDRFDAPYVVKADGLAAGKGVVIVDDQAQAAAAVEEMLGGRFGAAGGRVVIEEFMTGEEVSVFALCDGETALLFGSAQDHKRAYDGDLGPNTGGMGAYAPAPIFTPQISDAVRDSMIATTVKGMAVEGSPFKGVLFAGVMVTPTGPRLVEYNTRFGDPECQVIMLRLQSDLLPYLHAAATGALAGMAEPQWRDEAVICVVLAADGYPDAPQTGSVIQGADADFGPDVVVFHAGTATADGALVAAGGRVLNVCARGENLAVAREHAYAAIAKIDWPGGFHRTDIGWRALG
jgi:phosphoribosylamine--glycine ligase